MVLDFWQKGSKLADVDTENSVDALGRRSVMRSDESRRTPRVGPSVRDAGGRDFGMLDSSLHEAALRCNRIKPEWLEGL